MLHVEMGFSLKPFYLILVFVVFPCIISIGQQNTVDSLELVLKNAKSSRDSLVTMNLLTRVWGYRHLDTAFHIHEQVVVKATKDKDTLQLALALLAKARLYTAEFRRDYIYMSHRACQDAISLLKNPKYKDFRTWT